MKEIIEKYNNSREKINSQLENQLRNNTTDLANNPAIPTKDSNGNPINFLEIVAYKRFLEVIERVKKYTNIQDLSGQQGIYKMQKVLYDSVRKIFNIEKPNIPFLEKLAVDLVVDEMKIPNGAFLYDCKIVPIGSVSKEGFQDISQFPKTNEIDKVFGKQSAEKDMTPKELFELEKHKRRFINVLIQGSSKKGHYMYLLAQEKLMNINPDLPSLYGKMMSINDLVYWLIPDEVIKSMASDSENMAGKEEIDDTTDPPTIKTRAVCFPVSIHEIIKGIMEVFGTQGLPDEPRMAQMIIDSVDSLSNETTDLRLGVGIWEIFYNSYPPFVFEDEYKHIQHYMFSRFCALEVEEFFRVSKMILSDETKGKKYMLDLANEIKNDLQEREYNQSFDYDNDMTFAQGGSADEMTMIARSIEFITGTAIDRDSIVDKGHKFEFRYKGKSYVTSLDSKLVRDTIYTNRKSLAGRYSDGGKTDEDSFNAEGKSSLVYHEKVGNWLAPKGQIYFWLYEGEDSAEKVSNGEYDYVLYPLTTMTMAFQSGYIPPLKRIWTKKFQKDHKGSEHLLGVIKAYLIEEDGKKELYIDLMSVNPKNKKEGIMSYMIKRLRERYKLSQDQITFSDLTKEGEKFVAKKKYADGGGVDKKGEVKYGNLIVGNYYYQVTRPDFGIEKIKITEKQNGTYKYTSDRHGFEEYVTKYNGKYSDNEDLYGIFEDKEEAKEMAINLLKEKMSRYSEGGGVEDLDNYIDIDRMNPDKYKIVTDFRTLKSLANNGFIELHENTGLRYKNYNDKAKSQVTGYVTNVRHDYIKSATSPTFEFKNRNYAIGYIKGLNFLEIYVLEDISKYARKFDEGGGVEENNYRISVSENDKYIGEYTNPIATLNEAKIIFLELESQYKRPQYLISVSKRPTSTSGLEKINVDEWYEFAEQFAKGGNVEYKVNGLSKQDYIDAYNDRIDEVFKEAEETGEYNMDAFDSWQYIEEGSGFTANEIVGWYLSEYPNFLEVWYDNLDTQQLTSLDVKVTDILSEFYFEKPIKFKVNLQTGGDFALDMIDEMEKIKLLSNKFDFDEVRGNIDYEDIDNNTNLTFYKNGNEVMSLVGYMEDDQLKSTIELGDNTVELNYHPFGSLGGLSLVQLKENIDLAYKELNTFSAVISVDGYEEYAEDVEGFENAKKVLGNIKNNTRFQLLKGSSVGIGKRVDSSRVIEEFAKGGNVPNEDKMFQLPLEMVVYVPSTQDVDKVISVDEMDKRVDEVKQYLASKFGGYSATDKLGGYVDSTGKLVNEDVVQVTAFSTKEAYQQHKKELIKQLSVWGKKWGQEAIGFEFEGDLMYVPQDVYAKGGEIKDIKDLNKYLVYKYAGFNYHYLIGDLKFEINEFNDQKGWALNTYEKYRNEWHLVDSYGYEGFTLRECKQMILQELENRNLI
jgi:hypothetical protein